MKKFSTFSSLHKDNDGRILTVQCCKGTFLWHNIGLIFCHAIFIYLIKWFQKKCDNSFASSLYRLPLEMVKKFILGKLSKLLPARF